MTSTEEALSPTVNGIDSEPPRFQLCLERGGSKSLGNCRSVFLENLIGRVAPRFHQYRLPICARVRVCRGACVRERVGAGVISRLGRAHRDLQTLGDLFCTAAFFLLPTPKLGRICPASGMVP